MSTQPKTFLTPEQYLAIERDAPYKSEYHGGEMFAMAGAREAHNLISWNGNGELRNAFRSRPCRGYGSDMRVGTGPGDYVYPDISAVCGEPQFLDTDATRCLIPISSWKCFRLRRRPMIAD
jgi:Uma2 family endonuclease